MYLDVLSYADGEHTLIEIAELCGVPVWELVARMSPEEIVKLIDFRYITDCITPEEALAVMSA